MKRRLLLYCLPLVLFLAYAAYVLLGEFPDMLYTAQDRNEFFSTPIFFQQTLAKPFGLMTYLGSFLTQFFYCPACGVSLLLLLWTGIYVVSIQAFRLSAEKAALALLPLGCLLASITQVGYWIYLFTLPGYWFAQSLSFLCIVLLLWLARLTPWRWRALWYVVVSLLAFPFLGSATLLFAACLFVWQIFEARERRLPLWQNLAGLAFAVVMPLAWARLGYTELNLWQVLRSGIPCFMTHTDESLSRTYPFLFLALFSLVLSAPLSYLDRLFAKGPKRLAPWMPACLLVLAGGFVVGYERTIGFRDYNYQAEMRMNQAALEDDWQTILEEAERADSLTYDMLMLKNIALMNTGELGARSFVLGNNPVGICNSDSLNINSMQISAPIMYYQYGKIQFAMRWCMENAVGYGFSPYFLKVFMRAAQETGEQRLKQRYRTLMQQTWFYKDWQPLPTTHLVRRLHVGFSDVIDSDDNNAVQYLLDNFHLAKGSPDVLVQELNLFYSMLMRNPMSFWNAFYVYAAHTGGANLPLHYQEAYLIMKENYNVELPFQVQITPMVKQNYELYKKSVVNLVKQGYSEQQQSEMLYESWRHTYWWYLMFGVGAQAGPEA